MANQCQNTSSDGKSKCLLLSLPFEAIDKIFSYLSPSDLSSMACTNSEIRPRASSDHFWESIVQENVPNTRIESCYPFNSYKKFYVSLESLWFLPRNKIWSSNEKWGRFVITWYDQRNGRIEGFMLVPESSGKVSRYCTSEDQKRVKVYETNPTVALYRDEHMLRFYANEKRPPFPWIIPMIPVADFKSNEFDFAEAQHGEPEYHRQMWPPRTIPAKEHVYTRYDWRINRSNVSHKAFRIRKWVQLPYDCSPMFPRHTTYSTLHPTLYIPTPTRPWRGIWVGCYPGHYPDYECQFILMHQPDDSLDGETEPEPNINRLVDETDRDRVETLRYRGRLEAIKLTGDDLIGAGEYTFIADDLGPEGYIGRATEAPFTGVRMFKSRGNVAGRHRGEITTIDTRLYLISPDRMAQHWPELGYINFFHRVNIDEYLNPTH